LLSACAHIGAVCVRYARLVDFVERMLEKQLIAGIGKSLTARDFGVYMDFHARRLMAPAFRPLPVCERVFEIFIFYFVQPKQDIVQLLLCFCFCFYFFSSLPQFVDQTIALKFVHERKNIKCDCIGS
jgi:hypothetical protein